MSRMEGGEAAPRPYGLAAVTAALLFALAFLAGYGWPYARARGLARQYVLEVASPDKGEELGSADFDLDGSDERVSFRPGGTVVVEDRGRAILTLPYNHVDRTLRTRVALVKGAGPAPRLLLYDPTDGRGEVTKAYAWDGGALSVAPRTPLDEEVLYGLGIGQDPNMFRDVAMMFWPAALLPLGFVALRRQGR